MSYIGRIEGTFFFERDDSDVTNILSWSKDDGVIRYEFGGDGSVFDFNVFNDELYFCRRYDSDDDASDLYKITPGERDAKAVPNDLSYVTDIQLFSDGLLISGISDYKGAKEGGYDPIVAYLDMDGNIIELYTAEGPYNDPISDIVVSGDVASVVVSDVTVQINSDWSVDVLA